MLYIFYYYLISVSILGYGFLLSKFLNINNQKFFGWDFNDITVIKILNLSGLKIILM